MSDPVALSVARMGVATMRVTVAVGEGATAVVTSINMAGPDGGLGDNATIVLGELSDSYAGVVHIDNVYVQMK